MGSTDSDDFAVASTTEGLTRRKGNSNSTLNKRAAESTGRHTSAVSATAERAAVVNGSVEASGVEPSSELSSEKASRKRKGSKRKAGDDAAACMADMHVGDIRSQNVVSVLEGEGSKKKKKHKNQKKEKLPAGSSLPEDSDPQMHAKGVQLQGVDKDCSGGVAVGDASGKVDKKRKSKKGKGGDERCRIWEEKQKAEAADGGDLGRERKSGQHTDQKKKRKSRKTEETDMHTAGAVPFPLVLHPVVASKLYLIVGASISV